MAAILLLLVKIAIAALMLSIGMSARFADFAYLWRRPALLLRSLLAMYVLVPLAAYILVRFLPLTGGVKAMLLVFAVSAGAPLLPRKLEKFDGGAYAFSLVITSSLLAIVVVPAWVAWLAWHFEVAAEISALAVAKAMTMAFFLPLAAGMVLRLVAPALAERLAEKAGVIAGVMLAVIGAGLLVTHWELLLAVGTLGMLALIVLMLAALAIGHILGGPVPGNRTALAMACATRHIGIAVVVATTFHGPRPIVMLTVYVMATTLVSIPYLQWRRRSAAAAAQLESN